MVQMTSKQLMIIWLQCLFFSRCSRVAGTEIEYNFNINAKIGSAVTFNLPDVSKCAKFVFTDPLNNNVVTVYNMSYIETDIKYVHRSIITTLRNGTLVLALYKIQHSDTGTFLIKPEDRSSVSCQRKYVLTTYEETWSEWSTWSVCDRTCGPATRTRTRECLTTITPCNNRDRFETANCEENKQCDEYVWSEWSAWSNCSEHCGNGRHTRHRLCYRNLVQRVPEVNCNGEYYEDGTCFMKSCTTQASVGSVPNQWTKWEPWGACSVTCGHGFVTRKRRCHDHVSIIEDRKCSGISRENKSCMLTECDHITSPGSNSEADEKVIQLPLYSIVGAGAGIFIFILIIVICVLVMKLKKRGSFNRGKPSTDAKIRKKESVISFSSQGVSGVHVYDEIDDSKSQRMSVITIDNPYVTMSKSPRGQHNTKNKAVAYCNTQENVFVFDNSAIEGQYENRKVSCTYQNTESTSCLTDSNKLVVPRHMSVDSTGYLMPGTALERAAARRNKKYTK